MSVTIMIKGNNNKSIRKKSQISKKSRNCLLFDSLVTRHFWSYLYVNKIHKAELQWTSHVPGNSVLLKNEDKFVLTVLLSYM